MVAMNDESASTTGYRYRGRLRRFLKTSFFGVVVELFGCFVSARGRQFLFDRSHCFLRVNRSRISGDRFPWIAALENTLRDGVDVKDGGALYRFEFIPLKGSGNGCARKPAQAVSGDDRLRGPVTVNVEE